MSYKRKISYEDQKKLDRFALNLQTLRRNRKKTVREIADYLNMTTQQLKKYERGETIPSVLILIRLADLFDCRYNDFFRQCPPPVFPGINLQGHTPEKKSSEPYSLKAFYHCLKSIKSPDGQKLAFEIMLRIAAFSRKQENELKLHRRFF